MDEGNAAPSRRRHWWWVAGAGCGLIVLFGLMLVSKLGLQLRNANTELGQAEKSVDAFLEAAGGGDYAGAYELFTAKLSREKPLAQLQSEIQAHPEYFQVAETNFDQKSLIRVQERTVELVGSLKLQNGGTVPARFFLVVEGGYWLIDAYSVGRRG